ncbi:hypothetical protein [Desulfobulbus alkaliphilus]|uniref:hypothetical protein n=1 Tax=Desulfobulbus alkaliphilus TaxID=869814 RepID=UPI0019645D2F|nr:hypothetical protein [Desulfobulbus alkaliphilus]MBM9536292.1 hypothetical protein [Desulfobulbus alkaliphilus]
MTVTNQTNAFRAWLKTAAGYGYLTQFVSIMARRGRLVASGAGAGQSAWAERVVDQRQDMLQDLSHDFLLFLLDIWLTSATRNPEISRLFLTGAYRRVLELAWNRYLWRQQDQARSKQANPRGYLYRRLRELLNSAPHYTMTTNAQGLLCYHPVADPGAGDIEAATNHHEILHYSDWPPPPPLAGQSPEKYLFSGQWLAATAEFFWIEAGQRIGTPIAMPIRELCRYLAAHHPWLNNPQPQSSDEADLTDRLADPHGTPEQQIQRHDDLRTITALAAQLVATWPAEQQQVFALRLADLPAMTFREISEHLGFADHNRSYSLYQQATRSLQRFTATWPGPPLTELPREVAEVFIDEMKRLCKNSGN